MDHTFNTHRNHPLIQREQTYVMEKKLLAVHSEDRDFTQFPNSNHFSLDIGESMNNVESIRLVSYAFPNNCYNISTSYQNTKLAYTYTREYIFDATSVPVKPTISIDDQQAGGPGATGGADFKLGMFQSVLEQLFPGIIRPFRRPGGGGVGATIVDPNVAYFTPYAPPVPSPLTSDFETDWAQSLRGMIYTSISPAGIAAGDVPSPNFGELGLPNDVDVFYENNNLEWVSIKALLPVVSSTTPNAPWPENIDGWRSVNPVPETEWSGRFKICFDLKHRIITLPEGAYSPNDLAAVIQNKINEQIESYANALGHQFVATGIPNSTDVNTLGRTRRPAFINPANGAIVPADYTVPYYLGTDSPWYNPNIRQFKPIVVLYNPTTNNMEIGASEGSFTLEADREIIYTFEKCSPNKFMFSQYTKWGLPYYMGFNKKKYYSFDINLDNDIILSDEGQGIQTLNNGNLDFPRDVAGQAINNIFISGMNGLILYTNSTSQFGNSNWIEASGKGNIIFYDQANPPSNTSYNNLNRTVSILTSPNNVNLMGEDCIYMELEKYNNINEIYPFSERSNTLYNCDFGSKSDSAFAIIPLTQTPFGTELGNRTSFNTNAFFSEPPIKNVNRLEFKFRYHDGRLVDFKNLPFSFVLEFNMLREEQARNKVIRIPHLY